MSKFTIACGDDWQGLYKDGKLVYENHSIDAGQLAKYAGLNLEYRSVDSEWLERRGSLPELLKNARKPND